MLTPRRSTVLADARGGALSCLPHLSGTSPLTSDDRVERSAAQIAAVRVRVGAARVGEGVPGGVEAATAGVVYLVAAGAQGLFSYALFKGGGWVFQNKHPVWGVIFALGTMSSLWAAGRNWGPAGATLQINGQALRRGARFRYGHRHELEGSSLLVWIRCHPTDPMTIQLAPEPL